MKEIELKFAVRDFSPIRTKLRSLGAALLWKGREENWFYSRSNSNLQGKRRVLRIRTSDISKLTLKTNKHISKGVKVADEYEVAIDNPTLMKKILTETGFSKTFEYSKTREHWKLGNSFVELDTLRDDRKFVEIESTHTGIKKFARKLDLDFSRSTTDGYVALLTKKGTLRKS